MRISLVDLEVFYRVGVSDEERTQPQRLLITVDLHFDFTSAALSDRVAKTIDYHEVAQRLLAFGEGRSWKLIERVAWNIADVLLDEFRPASVSVEVKKFIIPQARFVSVSLTKTAERDRFNRAGR